LHGRLTHENHFSAYINGTATGHSYSPLDAAFVGTIAWKYDGLNSQAAMYFMRMIGAKEAA
jgi:hypothetical protein